LQGWQSPYAPSLIFYESGTWGPSKADEFINADQRCWFRGCSFNRQKTGQRLSRES
jgi:glucose-6-phosphate 1-dehydrogenase